MAICERAAESNLTVDIYIHFQYSHSLKAHNGDLGIVKRTVNRFSQNDTKCLLV